MSRDQNCIYWRCRADAKAGSQYCGDHSNVFTRIEAKNRALWRMLDDTKPDWERRGAMREAFDSPGGGS